MKYRKMLGLMVLAVGAMMVFAGGVSGTELTSPEGTTVPAGTKIYASSEGATSLTGTITVTCQKSAIEGEITNAGSPTETASGPVNSLTFSECGNHTVTVVKPGTLELHSSGKGTGTLTSTGAEITVLMHSTFLGTVHCIYKTDKTDIGTLTDSSTTGGTATLDSSSVSILREKTDGACGEDSTWEGSYSVSTAHPDLLYVDSPSSGVPVLTFPKGTQAMTGTKIYASSEGATSLTGTITVTCQKSAMEGEITNAGSATETAGGPVNALTFEECGNHTVTVLKPGSLELHSSGKGTGTLTSTGAEITVLMHSTFLGTVHCIYKTENTDIGTLTDSSTTGGTATLDINSVSIPQTPTGAACGGDSTWEGSYSVSTSSPDSLYVDSPGPGVPVLTSPEGTTVPAGTKIYASSESATSLTGTITVTCQKSAMEGEITNAGSATETAGGPVKALTFSECGNHTVTVVKPGTLELHSSGKNTGTLTSTGAEVTVLLHSVFLGTGHCIYKTENTDIGTLTDSSTTGGTATLDINSVSMPRINTDSLCGEHSTWEGSYSVSASSPDSLYVD